MHSDDDTQQPVVSAVNPADDAAIEQAQAREVEAEANRRAVTANAADAMQALGAIVAADDATISANSAKHIRTLARVVRLILRLQLGRFEGTT